MYDRVASGFVLATSQRTLQRTEKLKETVVGIGDDALGTIGRIMKTTKQMQYLLLPYNPQISATLDSTTEDLRSNSRVIRRFIDRSGKSFDKATHTSYESLNNFKFLLIVCSYFLIEFNLLISCF